MLYWKLNQRISELSVCIPLTDSPTHESDENMDKEEEEKEKVSEEE